MLHAFEPYADPYDNCLYCAVGNVLSWRGFGADSIARMFSSDLDFFYARTPGERVAFRVVEQFAYNFVLDRQPLEGRLRSLLETFDLCLEWNESADEKASWDAICERLEREPVVLFVDHFRMPYHVAYQRSHGGHFLTLAGRTRHAEMHVVDSVPSFRFRGTLPDTVLRSARVLQDAIVGIENGWACVDAKCRSGDELARSTWVRALRRAARRMTGRRDGRDRFFGVPGIAQFAADLQQWCDADGVREAGFANAARSLSHMFVSLLRVSQQRAAFARFLRSYPLLDGRPVAPSAAAEPWASVATHYEQLSKDWLVARSAIHVAERRRSVERLRRGAVRIGDLATREASGVEGIETLCRQLESQCA